jgi:ribonuclease VapC
VSSKFQNPVGYIFQKRPLTHEAKSFLENFFRLPINIVPPDGDLIWHAAELKADYAISFADCFVVATALKYEATIITGDPDFKKIKSMARVEWV